MMNLITSYLGVSDEVFLLSLTIQLSTTCLIIAHVLTISIVSYCKLRESNTHLWCIAPRFFSSTLEKLYLKNLWHPPEANFIQLCRNFDYSLDF